MIRLNGHLATSSAKSNTSIGSLFKINCCNIGATSRPPFRALKLALSSPIQSHGYMPAKSESISGRRSDSAVLLFCYIRDIKICEIYLMQVSFYLCKHSTHVSLMTIAPGVKKSPNNTIRLQPLSLTSFVSFTTSVTVSRA